MFVDIRIRVEADDDLSIVDVGEMAEVLLESMEPHVLGLTEWSAGGGRRGGGRSRTRRNDATEWLRERLADGPELAGDVQIEAIRAGIAPRTLRRAADEIVKKIGRSGPDVQWRLR